MSIILSTSTIKACDYFYQLCDYCGYDREWSDDLWAQIIVHKDMYQELVYYLENHTIMDKVNVCGYSITDLYVFQMNKYNLIREIGKNPVECNKERMVLNSFRMMTEMIKDPQTYVKRLEEGKGEDRL